MAVDNEETVSFAGEPSSAASNIDLSQCNPQKTGLEGSLTSRMLALLHRT
jgi:hypothetical protein